jgi:polyisoprenoid-binding protein YceI
MGDVYLEEEYMIRRILIFSCIALLLVGCAQLSPETTPTLSLTQEAAPAEDVVIETSEVPVTAATATESAPAVEVPTAAATPTEAADAVVDPTEQPSTNENDGWRTFVIVPEETQASYQVQEQFMNQSLPVMALGTTNNIEGVVEVNLNATPPQARIPRMVVDLRTLVSDNSRRDSRIRREWLESDRFPNAEFTADEVIDGPQTYTEGEEVRFTLLGEMTIREVSRPVEFDVVAVLQGDTITGTATTEILMRDFGFNPPDIIGVLTVEDGVLLTVDFTAREE